MALSPTDLPCPVAPATSRWGILVRSAMNTSLLMVAPRAMGSSCLHSWNFLDDMIERMDTICGSLLGTSMPMVPLPVDPIMRMPWAFRARARSSSTRLMAAMRWPSAGTTSNRVMVGPTVALIEEILMLNCSRALMMRSLFSSCSSVSMVTVLPARSTSRSMDGKRKCDSSAVGS